MRSDPCAPISGVLLKKTRGENAIGNVGIGAAFGLITTLVVVIGIIATFLAWQASMALAIGVTAVFVIGVLVLGVTQAALSGIYSAALYLYAVSHEAPAEFRWNPHSHRSDCCVGVSLIAVRRNAGRFSGPAAVRRRPVSPVR